MTYKTYTLKDLPYEAVLQQLSDKGFSLKAKEKGIIVVDEYSVNFNQDINKIKENLRKKSLDKKLESLIIRLIVGVSEKVGK